MEPDFDKTEELIPISIIENILITGLDFVKFIRYNDNKQYFNYSIDSIINSLNDYMSYMVEVNNSLNKAIFDRINYINTYYRHKMRFDYQEYLEKSKNYIPFNILIEILKNEDSYDNFLNCIYKNKPYNNIPINIIIHSLNYLVNRDNCYLSSKENIRKKYDDIINYCNILNKLATEVKPNYTLDKTLENKLMEKCDKNSDKFELARNLYFQSCKNLVFDVNFLVGENPEKNNIYNKSVKDINASKNRVICKTWAEIYASMCNKNGIRAIIVGDYHKSVILDCDGIIIKADATEIYSNDGEDIKMADIQRVKLGLKTAGYTPFIKSKNFYNKLNDVDSKIYHRENMYMKDKQKLIKEYEKNSKIPEVNNDILKNLSIVHDILSQRKDIDISKSLPAQVYFRRLMHLILSDEQLNNTKLFLVAKKEALNSFESNAILRITTNDNFEYYTYGKNGFTKISPETLKQMIKFNMIKMIDKNDIGELESGEVNGPNKRNKKY